MDPLVKILLPLVRKAYPDMLAKQLADVQPMSGQSGTIFNVSAAEVKENHDLVLMWIYHYHRRHGQHMDLNSMSYEQRSAAYIGVDKGYLVQDNHRFHLTDEAKTLIETFEGMDKL